MTGPASMPDELAHELLYDAAFRLGAPYQVGTGPEGTRAIFPVESGTFAGPRLNGRFLTGGGDWARIRSDGSIAVDARATAQTHDGALIHVHYEGRIVAPAELLPQLLDLSSAQLVPAERYYFRVTPYFETGHPDYAWLNHVCAVGVGQLGDGGVAYRVFRIL